MDREREGVGCDLNSQIVYGVDVRLVYGWHAIRGLRARSANCLMIRFLQILGPSLKLTAATFPFSLE